MAYDSLDYSKILPDVLHTIKTIWYNLFQVGKIKKKKKKDEEEACSMAFEFL